MMWHSEIGAALIGIGLSWLAICVGAIWLWWKEKKEKRP